MVGYLGVFTYVRDLDPVPSAMRICLGPGKHLDQTPDSSIEVFGRDGSLNHDQRDFSHGDRPDDPAFGHRETEFALEMEPWNEWAGMALDDETLLAYSEPAIVACCLWEMTFHGFEEALVAERREHLQKQVAELNAMTEEQREQQMIPWEKVLEELKADADAGPPAGTETN